MRTMKSAGSLLVTFVFAVVAIWLGLMLLGVAFRLVGVLILIGLAAAVYLGAQKLLGGPR